MYELSKMKENNMKTETENKPIIRVMSSVAISRATEELEKSVAKDLLTEDKPLKELLEKPETTKRVEDE